MYHNYVEFKTAVEAARSHHTRPFSWKMSNHGEIPPETVHLQSVGCGSI